MEKPRTVPIKIGNTVYEIAAEILDREEIDRWEALEKNDYSFSLIEQTTKLMIMYQAYISRIGRLYNTVNLLNGYVVVKFEQEMNIEEIKDKLLTLANNLNHSMVELSTK